MIYAFLAALVWGASYYVLGKLIKEGISYWVIGASFLPWNAFCFYMVTRSWNSLQTNLVFLNFLQVFLTVIAGFLVYLASKNTNMFITSMFEMLYPIFILCFMILFKEETFTWNKLVGFTVAIIGVIIATKK